MSGTKRSTSIIRCGGFFPTISIMACVLPTRRQEGARAKTPWQQRKRSVTFHHHNVMTRESTLQKRRRPTPSATTGEHSKRRREHLSRAKREKPSSWWPRHGSRKEERLLPSGSRGRPAPLMRRLNGSSPQREIGLASLVSSTTSQSCCTTRGISPRQNPCTTKRWQLFPSVATGSSWQRC